MNIMIDFDRQPLVSVIIPVRNGAATIGRAIRSILCQTYCLYEIIVVDDGSDDQTAKIVQGFGDRLTMVSQGKLGTAAARNRAVMLSQGELVAQLDADDEWAHDKLMRQVHVMEEHPGLAVLGTHRVRIGRSASTSATRHNTIGLPSQNASKSFREVSLEQQLLRNHVCGASAIMRRDVVIRQGLFDDSLPTMADYDLWLRLLLCGERIANLKDPLYVFYESDQSVRSDDDKMDRALRLMLTKWREIQSRSEKSVQHKLDHVFQWWLYKAAVRYHCHRRSDLCRLALEDAQQIAIGRLLGALIRMSLLSPHLLTAANQIKPLWRTTG